LLKAFIESQTKSSAYSRLVSQVGDKNIEQCCGETTALSNTTMNSKCIRVVDTPSILLRYHNMYRTLLTVIKQAFHISVSKSLCSGHVVTHKYANVCDIQSEHFKF